MHVPQKSIYTLINMIDFDQYQIEEDKKIVFAAGSPPGLLHIDRVRLAARLLPQLHSRGENVMNFSTRASFLLSASLNIMEDLLVGRI